MARGRQVSLLVDFWDDGGKGCDVSYLRPNLLEHERACVGTLFLVLFPRRSDGPASVHATVHVLLFLLRGFQDLRAAEASQQAKTKLFVRRGA